MCLMSKIAGGLNGLNSFNEVRDEGPDLCMSKKVCNFVVLFEENTYFYEEIYNLRSLLGGRSEHVC